MTQQSSSPGNRESGAVLIMMVFALIVLLALAALAVDAGNLYRHSLALQKAVDAAVYAGIGYSIELSEDEKKTAETELGLAAPSSDHRELIQLKAQQVFEENLRLMGMDPNAKDARLRYSCPAGESKCFTYDSASRTITAEVVQRVNLLLMHAVPFELLGGSSYAPLAPVRVSARARRGHANLSLIFDMSGSMACPKDAPDCDCMDEGGCSAKNESKMQTLVDSAKEMFKYFDATYDRVGIVSFAMRAESLKPAEAKVIFEHYRKLGVSNDSLLRCLISQADLATCLGHPSSLSPSSNTNVCEGLTQGYLDMKMDQGGKIKEDTAYVVFLDGAPTAATVPWAFPNKAAGGLPANNPWGQSVSGEVYAYTNFQTFWRTPGGGAEYYGPSLLVRPQSLDIQYEYPFPPEPDPSRPGLHVPTCNSYLPRGKPSEKYAPWDPKDFHLVTLGCLTNPDNPAYAPSLGFVLPDGAKTYARNLLDTPPAAAGNVPQHMSKIYYLCPLAMADVMRSNKGRFYVVGVGSPASIGADPYQNVDNWFLRKDVFNSKLANDKAYGVDRRKARELEPHPENWLVDSSDGPMSYSEWDAQTSGRSGYYFPSPESTVVHTVFRSIAKHLSMRLIQ